MRGWLKALRHWRPNAVEKHSVRHRKQDIGKKRNKESNQRVQKFNLLAIEFECLLKISKRHFKLTDSMKDQTDVALSREKKRNTRNKQQACFRHYSNIGKYCQKLKSCN